MLSFVFIFCIYAFMPALIWPTLVSMHTYECNYACMNVWVHAASDRSVGNRVRTMGDGGGRWRDCSLGADWWGMGLMETGWRMEEDHDA